MSEIDVTSDPGYWLHVADTRFTLVSFEHSHEGRTVPRRWWVTDLGPTGDQQTIIGSPGGYTDLDEARKARYRVIFGWVLAQLPSVELKQ